MKYNNYPIIEYTVYRNDEEITLDIHGYVTPFMPAKLSGHPDNWEAEEPEYVEIEKIILGTDVWNGKLTKEEKKEIEKLLILQFEDNLTTEAEEIADAKLDALKDRWIHSEHNWF